MRQERDLFSQAVDAAQQPQILFGVVGWDEQESPIFDKGDPDGGDGERHTLICVTLGARNAAKLKGTDRGGGKAVCWLNSLAGTRIPKKGEMCLVAIAHGHEENPGAGCIIAVRSDDPARLEEDRQVWDHTGEHVVVKAKSIVLEADDGTWLGVGEPRSGGTSGVTIQAKDGSGAVFQAGVASMFVAQDGDAKSLVQLTPGKAEIVHKDSGFMRLSNGEIVALSKGKASYIASSTFIGTGVPPVPPGGVVFGAQPTGAISTTVFVSN